MAHHERSVEWARAKFAREIVDDRPGVRLASLAERHRFAANLAPLVLVLQAANHDRVLLGNETERQATSFAVERLGETIEECPAEIRIRSDREEALRRQATELVVEHDIDRRSDRERVERRGILDEADDREARAMAVRDEPPRAVSRP